jgi:cellulose synthase/poly-beta-1,6-N-acetylglucosamine synthase-like glycosyltransferase
MLMNSSISVIIPSNHSHTELLEVLRALCFQTVKPTEIIVVDSSTEHGAIAPDLSVLCPVGDIKLIHVDRTHTFPGDARNIGLGYATSQLIAFIDAQTVPRPQWLEDSLRLLAADSSVGVWGSTHFKAETPFEKIVRDGFYGTSHRKTLPGSIFKREVFDKAGQFVAWVRAGEDTDWMIRVALHKLPIAHASTALIDYDGLLGMDIIKLLKKWHRNYTASRELPHFSPQKMLLWLVLYPAFILIAFNWNYLIADWRMASPLYIGHITKFAAIFPPIVYVFIRGLFVPVRRGVRFSSLLPIRFIGIALICLLADAVKAFVFTMPQRSYGKN